MLLKVKDLKKVLEDAPDDALVCSMNFGEDKLQTFSPKAYFIAKNDEGDKLFIFNNMGTSWTDRWKKSFGNVEIKKMIRRLK